MNRLSEESYNHEETEKLVEEVSNFFHKRLKLFIDNPIVKKQGEFQRDVKENGKRVIDYFEVMTEQEPIYIQVNSLQEAERMQKVFENLLEDLISNLEQVCKYNEQIGEEVQETVDTIIKAIEKCSQVFVNQCRRRKKTLQMLNTGDELRSDIENFISEMVGRYIIRTVMPGLYERLNNGINSVYIYVLEEINNFLRAIGIKTLELVVGEKVEPDYVEFSEDSSGNYTEDYNKVDTIAEIKRLPYVFKDEKLVVYGCVKIWRMKA